MQYFCALGAILCVAADATIVLDGAQVGRRFDGHGGLSAGASSRLLFDYPEPARSDILDYLYKPNFGAALSVCKVEIGGDVQSTNGVEASHMHTSKDLNLKRGYEWWLMAEAKKRNPKVATYALSWGVPGWIGDGNYFSDDNIRYQTAFVAGAKSEYNISVDYIGIWNERPWGNAEYVLKLRQSLDSIGATSTQIVGSDGAGQARNADHLKALASNRSLAQATHIQGGHYVCARDPPPALWEIEPAQTFWVNEDFSTLGGDWTAGGCWGRSLNQNFVKLNATSTVSWSTIWAVTDSWRYFGNGLMYAYEPWSGNYTVPPPIWTSAHVTQFATPGWRYLAGQGNGLLPGGGSWTTMIPPAGRARHSGMRSPILDSASAASGDFTLVIEKLEGACLRCKVPATTAETVSFSLSGSLAQPSTTTLSTWVTNSSVSFLKVEDTPVIAGSFSVHIPRDTIITLTTTTGQAKGHAPSCSSVTPTMCTGVYKPFPFPYHDNYDAGQVGRFAKYHSDNGGAFEIREDATGSGGSHLFQASPRYPQGTQWAGNFDPITSIGATDWVNLRANISVMLRGRTPAYALGDPMVPFPTESGLLTDRTDDPISKGIYAGVCVRQIDQYSTGVCLLLGVGLTGLPQGVPTGWVLQAGATHMARSAGGILASGSWSLEKDDLTIYHNLSLAVQGSEYTAVVDGKVVVDGQSFDNLTGLIPPVGQVALRSSFSYAQFDNLFIEPGPGSTPPTPENVVIVKHLLYPPTPPPGGRQAPAKVKPGEDGQFGCSFTLAKDITITALARLAVSTTGVAASRSHKLSLLELPAMNVVGDAEVDLKTARGGDLNGYAWGDLSAPAALKSGHTYALVSEEQANGDSFYDGTVMVTPVPGLIDGLIKPWASTPAPDNRVWHSIINGKTGQCLDTPGDHKVDTWNCVTDGHNEGFNYSTATGLITVGPQTLHNGAAGLCIQGVRASASTSRLVKCDTTDPNQVFKYSPDKTLRVSSNADLCLTGDDSRAENGVVSLSPCLSPPSALQQWTFKPIHSSPSSSPQEWSTCFGPLNMRFK